MTAAMYEACIEVGTYMMLFGIFGGMLKGMTMAIKAVSR